MTLIHTFDLDYHLAKNKVFWSMHSKVIACTDRHTVRHTDRQHEIITLPRTLEVKMMDLEICIGLS